VVTGRSRETLETAIRLGANLSVQAKSPEATQRIKQFSGTDGVQCVFDCVGTAETMKESSTFAMRGGQIIVIGEEAEFPEIDTIQIAQRELEIIGSRNGSKQDTADSLAMMEQGLIKPPIVKEFPLEMIQEAMDFVRSGKAHGRVVITVRA